MSNSLKFLVVINFLSFCLQANVDHKDEFIDTYLGNISSNMEEKTQMLPYIQEKREGQYLDIGTGGDAIAVIAESIDPELDVTLIAADIDPAVLDAIPKRRKEIVPFLQNKHGVKVELKEMSAVNLNKISDDSLNGIGASALTHEVFSYVSSLSSIDQFMKEVCRTLNEDGVFIYRDPKWVDNPKDVCLMSTNNKMAKYYITLFMTKFLDREFSLIRDYEGKCCKPYIHKTEDVFFHVIDKSIGEKRRLSFMEFITIPSSEIDYEKNFSIEAPRGLLAEVERHYCMFLKNYFCPGLLEETLFEKDLDISLLDKEDKNCMIGFCEKNQISLFNNTIPRSEFPRLFKEKNKLEKLFENALVVSLNDNHEFYSEIHDKLKHSSYNNLFFMDANQDLHLDIKLLTLLFHGKNVGVYKSLTEEKNIPWDILEHLKLEGEEHYFYKTTEELILYFGKISKFFLKNSSKSNLILSPTSLEGVKEATRDYYKNILQRDFIILDFYGNRQPFVTEKNILHMKLQNERAAHDAYKSLIDANPEKYKNLKIWVENEFGRAS